jgi:hypothetical protein
MINGRGRQLGRPRCPTILPDLRVEFWKRCLDEVTAPQFLGLFKIGLGRLHELLLFRRIK